ncbi:MAG: hypothetical protein H0U12_01245 [Thermoleophilaceae bacterium]|nr:hypothetical protein [Thermoleophilaceae bacterium]
MSPGLRHRERHRAEPPAASGEPGEKARPASAVPASTAIFPRPSRGPSRRGIALKVAALVILGLAFEVAYGQSPLYTGNQHTYLLHGLSQAGVGLLEADWQAGTADPAPVTSLLVAAAAKLGSEWLLLLFHALLIGAYGVALAGIGITLSRLDDWPGRLVLIAALIAAHSAIAAELQGGLPGDVRSLVTRGLAGQFAPGFTFQPSLFGVLLVVSLLLYARGRLTAAIATAGAAAIFHPTYLLGAAVLSGAYLADTFAGTGRWRALLTGAGAAAVTLVPVGLYAVIAFGPAPGPLHEAAQSVLVDFRIPHHAKPEVWFAPDDAIRLGIVAAGVALAWRTVLFPVLALAVAAGGALTAIQLVTGSETLALLFPWRVSIFLVPVCAAIVLAAATRAIFGLASVLERLVARLRPDRAARLRTSARAAACGLAGLVIAVSLVAGLARLGRLGPEPRQDELGRLVAAQRSPGDLYLVPPRMYEFRLDAGAPIYVDYKTHPYEDREVLEWRRRLREVTRVYARRSLDCAALERTTRAAGITHVVVKAPTRARCDFLTDAIDAERISVFRVEADRGRRAGGDSHGGRKGV